MNEVADVTGSMGINHPARSALSMPVARKSRRWRRAMGQWAAVGM